VVANQGTLGDGLPARRGVGKLRKPTDSVGGGGKTEPGGWEGKKYRGGRRSNALDGGNFRDGQVFAAAA